MVRGTAREDTLAVLNGGDVGSRKDDGRGNEKEDDRGEDRGKQGQEGPRSVGSELLLVRLFAHAEDLMRPPVHFRPSDWMIGSCLGHGMFTNPMRQMGTKQDFWYLG
jgi:hypothetical protein